MTQPLVVGVDGSDNGLRATDWAADEAARFGLPLRLVYASMWERYEGTAFEHSSEQPGWQELAQYIVRTAAERVGSRRPDVAVTTEILPKDTVAALLREGTVATALVTGNRGRGEFSGLLLGSVSLSVAARATCPVVVVRGDGPSIDSRHGRVLLGVGDTESDSAAVRFAFREAAVRDCVLDVVRAWRSPSPEGAVSSSGEPSGSRERQAADFLDATIEPAVRAHPDVKVRRSALEGPAHKVLIEKSAATDLLVVGARRRHSQIGMQLGRVAHRALHHATCPVAVVPQSP
jgi:nucleotide-binding universal stress UspA family protein